MWPPGYEPIDPAHDPRHRPWRECFSASILGLLFLVWYYSSYDTAPTVSQIVDKVAFLKLFEGKKVGEVLG